MKYEIKITGERTINSIIKEIVELMLIYDFKFYKNYIHIKDSNGDNLYSYNLNIYSFLIKGKRVEKKLKTKNIKDELLNEYNKKIKINK